MKIVALMVAYRAHLPLLLTLGSLRHSLKKQRGICLSVWAWQNLDPLETTYEDQQVNKALDLNWDLVKRFHQGLNWETGHGKALDRMMETLLSSDENPDLVMLLDTDVRFNRFPIDHVRRCMTQGADVVAPVRHKGIEGQPVMVPNLGMHIAQPRIDPYCTFLTPRAAAAVSTWAPITDSKAGKFFDVGGVALTDMEDAGFKVMECDGINADVKHFGNMSWEASLPGGFVDRQRAKLELVRKNLEEHWNDLPYSD
jgi:hypothetical protein